MKLNKLVRHGFPRTCHLLLHPARTQKNSWNSYHFSFFFLPSFSSHTVVYLKLSLSIRGLKIGQILLISHFQKRLESLIYSDVCDDTRREAAEDER